MIARRGPGPGRSWRATGARARARACPPEPLHHRAAGPPPTRNPPRSRSSARHATRQAANNRASRRPELGGTGRATPRPSAHSARSRRAVRTCTPAQPARRRRATWRSSRVRCTCSAETVRYYDASALGASRQLPTSRARSGQPRGGRGCGVWWKVGGGGRRRRWAQRRSGAGAAQAGKVRTFCGSAVETRVARGERGSRIRFERARHTTELGDARKKRRQQGPRPAGRVI